MAQLYPDECDRGENDIFSQERLTSFHKLTHRTDTHSYWSLQLNILST